MKQYMKIFATIVLAGSLRSAEVGDELLAHLLSEDRRAVKSLVDEVCHVASVTGDGKKALEACAETSLQFVSEALTHFKQLGSIEDACAQAPSKIEQYRLKRLHAVYNELYVEPLEQLQSAFLLGHVMDIMRERGFIKTTEAATAEATQPAKPEVAPTSAIATK